MDDTADIRGQAGKSRRKAAAMDHSPLRCAPLLLASALALTLSSCATTSSTAARPLEGANAQSRPLAACRHLTVAPFTMPPTIKAKYADVGTVIAQDVARRLASNFGTTFESVARAAAPRRLDGECLLTGAITEYHPGSKVIRAVPYVGGLMGAASLKGSIAVQDVASGTPLLAAPFDKLWMWSGISGATKGIDDMVAETTARIANTVARARGWVPPHDDDAPDGSRD
jgi:hypothetical protein